MSAESRKDFLTSTFKACFDAVVSNDSSRAVVAHSSSRAVAHSSFSGSRVPSLFRSGFGAQDADGSGTLDTKGSNDIRIV